MSVTILPHPLQLFPEDSWNKQTILTDMVSGKISLDYAMEIANDVLPKEEVKGYISLLQEAHYKTNV